MMNTKKGNMYEFVTHTWNPIKGKCLHDCEYCYMKAINPNAKAPRLVKSEFATNLGNNNFIFIGSSIDMFANDIPDEWIKEVLNFCLENHKRGNQNAYLLQSKNPERFLDFMDHPIMKRCVFATTIESNHFYPEIMNNAPDIHDRAKAMEIISQKGFVTMVTAEPLLQFDLLEMEKLILQCQPRKVNFGKNTRRELQLPEPTPEEAKELISKIKLKTKVEVKRNAWQWNL